MEIRTATLSDAPGILAIYRPFVENTAVSFEVEVPAPDEMQRRIAAGLDQFAYFVAEDQGVVIGYAYGSAYRARAAYAATAEVTIYLAEACRGQGIGTRLYQALIAALQARGFRSLIAVVSQPNPGSAALHERCGFRHVGQLHDVGRKFGVWHSTDLYQLVLTD